MIIQGANNPIVVKFDADISTLPALLITLWHDSPCDNSPVKQWMLSDMTVDGDTAVCPITAEETAGIPLDGCILEAKGLDGNGNTVFWGAVEISTEYRRDKAISLTQG